jgi:hypothetical protein
MEKKNEIKDWQSTTGNQPFIIAKSNVGKSRMSEYFNKISSEDQFRYQRAFEARLAYERNCIAKYDYPDFMQKPSRPQKRGDTMLDYAMRYDVSIKDMKDCERQVDYFLKNEK